ncbi:caspase-8 isoform X2 [Scaptodrosophila lebanonensis]|uniref:Caspase-8 isoform X2 n=1 Tax=Drosophila lebanonensis TaxID=7225 RepID=A0A6J2TRC5_DROLE|nr:caspase-8 isoform X2 [Scaptodrosophila lebanonensis]
MTMSTRNGIQHMDTIDVEDLPYIERDLNFAQKHSNAEYVLQKLLTLARANSISGPQHHQNSDLLRQYAHTNQKNWRAHLIEALTIINARRVLRKLGFQWQELRLHYLPHIHEVTLHVHPLLKALYIVCEQLTLAQSSRLVLSISDMQTRINAQQQGPESASANDRLLIYDFAYLEIFLLHWLTRRIIKLGDINAEGSDMQILIEYFKFNNLESLSSLLIQTINSNATSAANEVPTQTLPSQVPAKCEEDAATPTSPTPTVMDTASRHLSVRRREKGFNISRKNAGIVLIINQQSFHTNVAEGLQNLLPTKNLEPRLGTDKDKERLKKVFSALGYMVEAHDNLNHLQMLQHIRDACARSCHRDSLIVCILSHGFEGAVYGHDSIALKISEIENVLCSNENLSEKPKVLIIQACQQNDMDNKTLTINATIKCPKNRKNLLKAMSTVQGFVALRHTSEGSWFIQSLCDAIEQYAESEHMLDILTHVICHVSKKRGNKNQVMMPQIESTLSQYFYLPNVN